MFLEKALYLSLYSIDCLVGIGCFGTISLRLCNQIAFLEGKKPLRLPSKLFGKAGARVMHLNSDLVLESAVLCYNSCNNT